MVNRKSLILFCLCILFLSFIFAVPFFKVLSISNRKNPGKKIYIQPCDGFIISYTHSVNKGRVHDFYSYDKNGGLILNATEFVSYGAGIPEAEETPGAVFEALDSGYLIKNLNRKMPKLTMAVGVIANHSIMMINDDSPEPYYFPEITESKETFFTEYFEPQTSLYLEIKRVNFFDYIYHII